MFLCGAMQHTGITIYHIKKTILPLSRTQHQGLVVRASQFAMPMHCHMSTRTRTLFRVGESPPYTGFNSRPYPRIRLIIVISRVLYLYMYLTLQLLALFVWFLGHKKKKYFSLNKAASATNHYLTNEIFLSQHISINHQQPTSISKSLANFT